MKKIKVIQYAMMFIALWATNLLNTLSHYK